MEDTVDRLTGLCDRDRFARAVDQADRDRDRLVVAVIAIDGLVEINQLCGYEAGDALLAELGRALLPHHSVDVTVGRIGGGQLGLLVAPAGDRQPERTAAPVVDDLTLAIDRWRQERSALGTPSPITPVARTGVAAGYGGGTWGDAEAALAVALDRPEDGDLVAFDLGHPRLGALRRRQRLVDDLASTVGRGRLPVARTVVEPLDPEGARWVGLRARTGPGPGGGRSDGRLVADDLALAPGLAGRIDEELLTLPSVDREASGQARRRGDRVSVALLGPLAGPRSAIEAMADTSGQPSVVSVAVDQGRLLAHCARSGDDGSELARRLHRAGIGLAVDRFDGGWEIVDLLERLPVHHLAPDVGLLRAARVDRAEATILLAGVARIAGARGWPLVAPADVVDVGTARDLGLTHLERAED